MDAGAFGHREKLSSCFFLDLAMTLDSDGLA